MSHKTCPVNCCQITFIDTMLAAQSQLEREQIGRQTKQKTSPRVIEAYETRIDELERKKLTCQEKAGKMHQPKHSFEEMFELSIQFLSNPHKLWGSGKFNLQRTMLKLVFSERLSYDRNEGFRTPKTALPFRVLGSFFGHENKMVRWRRWGERPNCLI